jgi:CDP-2,3-bis-(O-geranylgeranyl)-sn-glycerol synthase
MNLTPPLAEPNLLLIMLAMSMAGFIYMAWLKSSLARQLGQPVDFGLRFRGRRIFGPNKTWRGIVGLPLASAMSFTLIQMAVPYLPTYLQSGWWTLSSAQVAALGFSCGMGFMLAELPNSFIKRQLDIASGSAPTDTSSAALRITFAIIDRCDSSIGLVLVLALLMPVHHMTLIYLGVLGSALHALFSLVQFQLGLKGRAL